MHPETIRHRWVCPGRADAREGIKQETIDYALRDGNELLAERGLVHHPASIQPLPKSGLHYLTFGYYGEGKKEEDIVFSGEVAMDGSCFPHPCKDLWRAGWSVLEFDERGDILRGIMGNVPAELPQTSVSGEYCAAAAFLEKSRAGAVGHSDCANVVKDWEAGDRRANLRPDKATAGFWKHCCAFGASPSSHPICKVKAHQDEHQAEGPRAKQLARANASADTYAKEAARDLHPVLKEDDSFAKATEVAIALAKMAAKWEQAPRLARVQSVRPAGVPRDVLTRSIPSTRAAACRLKVFQFNNTLARPHRLKISDDVVWCLHCGSFGEGKAVNLLRPSGCPGAPQSNGQKARLKHLRAGRHPKTLATFTDSL